MDPLVDGIATGHHGHPRKPTPKSAANSDGGIPSEICLPPSIALNKGEIAALTLAIRQLGVGSQGGAEALAIFHQHSTTFGIPLARIKVDEKKCFAMIEWKAVREAARQFLSKHAGPADWKHRAFSYVEQEGLPPMPKDRGAEQGDVDGPCSLALGVVAAQTRGNLAAQQAAGLIPWIGICDSTDFFALHAEHASRTQQLSRNGR